MESSDRDQVDRWLDRALKASGNVEPRQGLHARILANCASEREKRARRWRWLWGTAGVCAAAAVIVVFIFTLAFHMNRSSIAKSSVGVAPAAVMYKSDQHFSMTQAIKQEPRKTRRRGTRNVINSSLVSEPTLPQFPSQRPLSEQEQLLQQYVSQFPDQAKLVAREQVETEKQMEQLYAENAQGRNSQQER